MAVTIVSTMPQPSQTTAIDNMASSGNTTSGDNAVTLDFANLLKVQMRPRSPTALETIEKATEQTTQTITEPTPSDAAALLATLGLIPQDPSRKADATKIDESSLQDISQAGNVVSDISGSAPIAIQTIAQNAGPGNSAKFTTSESATVSLQAVSIEGTEKNLKDTAASGIPVIEERPAKFAAATAITSATENAATQTVSEDATQSAIPVFVGSTQSNLNTARVRHEASLSVPTPVRDPGWASDLGQKIMWLASNDKQSAQITLNPQQMGPIEISLSLDKGSASASFTSANAEVRNALETAMPRLREMFASAGIELGQTNVSAESFKQQAENGNANRGSSQWRSDNAILVADSAMPLSARAFSQQGNGLVDLFA